MMIKILFDETMIQDEQRPRSNIGMLLLYLRRWLRDMVALIPTDPPYRYKGPAGLLTPIKPNEIGKTIRIEPASIEKEFEIHIARLKLYNSLTLLLFIVFSLLVVTFAILFFVFIDRTLFKSVIGISFNTISIPLGLITAILSMRITNLLLDRRFADSLILLSSLYLIYDLQHYDNLSDPEFKRIILERIRILRRNIILLSQTFIENNLSNNQEAVLQLRNIEVYIRERENWVIAPKKNTLDLLRKDFDKLAVLLISGQYGEFKVKGKSKIKEIAPVPQTFTDNLLRFIFFLFPYILLLALYVVPNYITSLGLNITTVFLVALVWILLTVDVRLKLGFVERIAGLAKTLRELR